MTDQITLYRPTVCKYRDLVTFPCSGLFCNRHLPVIHIHSLHELSVQIKQHLRIRRVPLSLSSGRNQKLHMMSAHGFRNRDCRPEPSVCVHLAPCRPHPIVFPCLIHQTELSVLLLPFLAFIRRNLLLMYHNQSFQIFQDPLCPSQFKNQIHASSQCYKLYYRLLIAYHFLCNLSIFFRAFVTVQPCTKSQKSEFKLV